MEIALLILRLALAAVFGIAAFAKLFDPKGSEKALNDFGVPTPLVRPMMFILPAAELLIAASMLFVSTSWFGAIGAVGILLVFTAGMLYQLAKGNAPDCHCFGQLHNEPVGTASVVRNIVLIALAGFLAFQGPQNQGLALINSERDILQFVVGLTVIVLLGLTIMLLMKLTEQQVQLMKRIEVMELVSRDGGAVERENVGDPHEGLPIGAVFPEFALKNVDGATVTLAGLRSDGLPILFIFISPSCTPCKSLVPDFELWQKELSGKVKLVFVSSGKEDENIEKFGSGIAANLLLQENRELADIVKAKWTPTAIFMDAGARIASHAAAGDSAIRALAEEIKTTDTRQDFIYFTNGNGHGHSMKIGDDVPEFKLPDLNGREISDANFKGKQTLVAFWSLTCPHCVKMMEELREWEMAKGADEPALVVFSDGDKAEHEELGLESPILLESGYKTAGKLGMFGTPSAVLVNEDGKIITETAMGAEDIWSLIGRRQ